MSNNYNSTLQSNNTDLQAILNTINELPEANNGVELPTLTNEGSASDLLSGKQLIDQEGNIVTGTIATKTASNLTANGATVTVPAGYYSTQASKAVSTATQATPTVTINSSTGLVTATATQTAGYVTAGSKSGTLQLAFQAAQTITPGTTNKTIAANTYLGGVQTIKGDANLVASNIVSGKSIFGVVGTASTGGGTSVEDSLITRTITSYENSKLTSVGRCAFYECSKLTSVSLPACKDIDMSAFYLCSSLSAVDFPSCTHIGSSAFRGAFKLTSVSFPICKSIEWYAFFYCPELKIVSFPVCTHIGAAAFQSCTKLTSIYLMASSVCQLNNSNAFSLTGIWTNKGSIFVPSSLVASYKSATNWSYFSNRIFSAP